MFMGLHLAFIFTTYLIDLVKTPQHVVLVENISKPNQVVQLCNIHLGACMWFLLHVYLYIRNTMYCSIYWV